MKNINSTDIEGNVNKSTNISERVVVLEREFKNSSIHKE